MEWLGRSFRGEEELWKVFWLYGVVLSFWGQALFWGLKLFTPISVDSPGSIPGKIFIILEILYFLWLLVSLWRCAFNVMWRGWGFIIRLIVILDVVAFCALSYAARSILMPADMANQTEALKQKWQEHSATKKKKPTYTIKVNKI